MTNSVVTLDERHKRMVSNVRWCLVALVIVLTAFVAVSVGVGSTKLVVALSLAGAAIFLAAVFRRPVSRLEIAG